MSYERSKFIRGGIEFIVYDDEILLEFGRYGIARIDREATAEKLTEEFSGMDDQEREDYMELLMAESERIRQIPGEPWLRRCTRIDALQTQYELGIIEDNGFGEAVIADLSQIGREHIEQLEGPIVKIPEEQTDGLINRLDKEGRLMRVDPDDIDADLHSMHLLTNGSIVYVEESDS